MPPEAMLREGALNFFPLKNEKAAAFFVAAFFIPLVSFSHKSSQ